MDDKDIPHFSAVVTCEESSSMDAEISSSLYKAAKSVSRPLLDAIPLSAWMHVFPQEFITLAYHMVSDRDLPHVKYYSYKTSKMFENDVMYVVQSHEYMRRLGMRSFERRKSHLRRNQFVFTIDDGFAEGFDVIRPILKKHDVGAIFFITTNFLDDRSIFFETKVSLCLSAVENSSGEHANEVLKTLRRSHFAQAPGRSDERERTGRRRLQDARVRRPISPSHEPLFVWLLGLEESDGSEIDDICRTVGVDPLKCSRDSRLYMSSDQVRTLVDEGFTVGAHGLSHAASPAATLTTIEKEMVESSAVIRDLTGQAIVPFAFPYGARHLDRSELGKLLAKHQCIGPLFDIGGIRPTTSPIIDRLIVDSPVGAYGNQSNLPLLLHNAWSRRSAWRVARKPAR